MNIGFTGTRKGMTPRQRATVAELCVRLTSSLLGPGGEEASHGCAEGADRQFHVIVRGRGPRHLFPVLQEQLAWAKAHCDPTDWVYEGYKDPIARNHLIVDRSDALIAAPSGIVELARGSGTWATIRYARKVRRPRYIVWPDGIVSAE